MESQRTRTAGDPSPDATLVLAELLSHCARRLRRGSTTQLAPLGVTNSQARVLRIVGSAGRPLRMADVAAGLEVVPRSVTTMVDAVEAAGLLVRRVDPEDRRSVLVDLTPDGRALLARLDHARRTTADEIFGDLEEHERAELAQLLQALCQRGACSSCAGPPDHGHGTPHGHDAHSRRTAASPRPAEGEA